MPGFEQVIGLAGDRRSVILLLACTLLSGCASLAPVTQKAPASSSEPSSRTYKEAVDISGRLSVRYQKDGNDEALHGSFTWLQSSQRTTVTLASPTGQILATIDILPTSATITQAGNAARSATDVDALASEALGWPIPVSGLRNWLQGFGLDDKGRPFIASPATAGTLFTTIDGWGIRYVSWDDVDGSVRPKRIDLERATAHGGNVSLRVVFDSW